MHTVSSSGIALNLAHAIKDPESIEGIESTATEQEPRQQKPDVVGAMKHMGTCRVWCQRATAVICTVLLLATAVVSAALGTPVYFVGVAFLFGVIWYIRHVWSTLFSPWVPKQRVLRLLSILTYAAILTFGFLAFVLDYFFPPNVETGEPYSFWIFCNNMAGSLVCLILASWLGDIFDIFHYVGKWIRLKQASSLAAGPKRSLLCFGVAVILIIYSAVHGNEAPRVMKLEVPLPLLPACMNGFRIVMIADIHGGTITGRSEVIALVQQTNQLNANAVFIVGDISDGTTTDLDKTLEPLEDINAPDGKFFVTGNHERYFDDPENWKLYMQDKGYTCLANEFVDLPNNSTCSIDLIGLEDREIGSDLDAAVTRRNTSRASILLAHQPVEFLDAVGKGIGLTLSGHTHGGHIFPIHAFAYLEQQSFVAGLFRKENSLLYVSEGAMGWGPRTRLLSSREITEITLRNPESYSAEKGKLRIPVRSSQQAAFASFAFIILIASFYFVNGPVKYTFNCFKSRTILP